MILSVRLDTNLPSKDSLRAIKKYNRSKQRRWGHLAEDVLPCLATIGAGSHERRVLDAALLAFYHLRVFLLRLSRFRLALSRSLLRCRYLLRRRIRCGWCLWRSTFLIRARRVWLILRLEDFLQPRKCSYEEYAWNHAEDNSQNAQDEEMIACLIEPPLVHMLEDGRFQQNENDEIRKTGYYEVCPPSKSPSEFAGD